MFFSDISHILNPKWALQLSSHQPIAWKHVSHSGLQLFKEGTRGWVPQHCSESALTSGVSAGAQSRHVALSRVGVLSLQVASSPCRSKVPFVQTGQARRCQGF